MMSTYYFYQNGLKNKGVPAVEIEGNFTILSRFQCKLEQFAIPTRIKLNEPAFISAARMIVNSVFDYGWKIDSKKKSTC